MGWKKHFKVYQPGENSQSGSPLGNNSSTSKFQSWLPEVYTGMPNRVERYMQYDQMDMDSEINMALDTIAEFSTQIDEETASPFKVVFKDDPTDSESQVIQQTLRQWCNINEWDRRIFKTFRNVVKYGDQPFIRDPDTWELMYVNPQDVTGAVINESEGKDIVQYVIRNVDLNIGNKTATTPIGIDRTTGGFQGGQFSTPTNRTVNTQYGGHLNATPNQELSIDAKDVVHIALTEGMDANWPFGNSILDPLFKTYKQKELLEDAIIIYRVQRAPERRVFYIDVGEMPPHKAGAFLEKIKMEVHQKRIPNKSGGGSNVLDAQYNPMCLALDTTVPLLDGRTLSLTELIAEYKSGIENWTFSCDPITGKILPGNITWAGITRPNTQVIKLILNDGSSMTVTPDHKIPVLGKGFVEAQDLTPDDSLISYNTRKQGLSSSSSDRTYTQIYDHESNEWIYAHRMVGDFFRKIGKHQEFTYLPENVGAHKSIVHHKDYDRYNNDPRNLQWMNKTDHIKYHQEQNMWQHITTEEADRIKAKISKTVKAHWASGVYSVEASIDKARAKFHDLLKNDMVFRAKYSNTRSVQRKKFMEDNPDFLKKVLLPNISRTWAETIPNQKKTYTFDQLQAIYDLAEMNDFKLKFMLRDVDNHAVLLSRIQEHNKPEAGKNFRINMDTVTQQVIYNTIRHFGYENWMDFKRKKLEFNHRVVSIEWLDQPQDTGTLTIDGKERWHDHHTFPINDSIFVKNSMLEDYFFAQNSDGRGSKVETLPGGDGLGEIGDLTFFTDKLMRALRIPSSYMPMTQGDAGASYSDGRVGSAFIQEFRFNVYCQRLQNSMQPTFDREFKLFMKNKGLTIDASSFDIRFTEPQSFSDYRQIELDGSRASLFNQMEGSAYLSKRFILQKYLGLSKEEILENERMYLEENPLSTDGTGSTSDQDIGLSDVGIKSGDFDMGDDDFDMGEMEDGTDNMSADVSPLGGVDAGNTGDEEI